ncbi:MAG: hypothetical protein ACREA3_03210 [Nitrosotalea sp.]
MTVEEVSADVNSTKGVVAEEFLKSMVKSSNRKKILVHFKFRDSTEFKEWMTSKQYYALRTMGCLEFCRKL